MMSPTKLYALYFRIFLRWTYFAITAVAHRAVKPKEVVANHAVGPEVCNLSLHLVTASLSVEYKGKYFYLR